MLEIQERHYFGRTLTDSQGLNPNFSSYFVLFILPKSFWREREKEKGHKHGSTKDGQCNLCHIQIKIPFKISLMKRCIVGYQFRMDRGVKSNLKSL